MKTSTQWALGAVITGATGIMLAQSYIGTANPTTNAFLT